MVVLAHDTAVDPVFFYGNLAAQHLFELNWNELVQLPSRFSAEPVARDERQRLLDLVTSQGFIDNYSGVRIAKSGKRFLIKHATVWNLRGKEGQVLGQAAAFDHWVEMSKRMPGAALPGKLDVAVSPLDGMTRNWSSSRGYGICSTTHETASSPRQLWVRRLFDLRPVSL